MAKEHASQIKGAGSFDRKSGPAFCNFVQFLAFQTTEVLNYIQLNKLSRWHYLCYTGMTTKEFFMALVLIEKEAAKETPTEYWQQKFTAMANRSLKGLFELENTLDIGIGDQLKEELKAICSNYLNGQFAEDSGDGLQLRLKMQLCGCRRGTNRTEETSNLTPHASSMYN